MGTCGRFQALLAELCALMSTFHRKYARKDLLEFYLLHCLINCYCLRDLSYVFATAVKSFL